MQSIPKTIGDNLRPRARPSRAASTQAYPAATDGEGRDTKDSAYFTSANRGKKSITLNISKPEGQKLVRELIAPNFDIHPEMITHTRVIDLKTGRPMAEINNSTMENSYPSMKKSVDEIAEYLAYALKILKN